MKSKHFARLLALLAAAVAAVAMLAPAAQARTPAPGYERFAGCPSPEEKPGVGVCILSVASGGHFQMGNKDVSITNPITVSGGIEKGAVNFSYNSKGGMPPVKQKVPGGVVGITGLTWLTEFLGIEALTLYAATELAGTPVIGITSVTLPIKVHLINAVLGNNCYVGSSSNPINLKLITGTTAPPPPNEPISGSGPAFSTDSETGITTAEGTYVDNSFSAPGASGCVLTLLGFIPIPINGLVNTASGLPAAAGTNETIQEITSELVVRSRVYP